MLSFDGPHMSELVRCAHKAGDDLSDIALRPVLELIASAWRGVVRLCGVTRQPEPRRSAPPP